MCLIDENSETRGCLVGMFLVYMSADQITKQLLDL